MKKQYIAYRGLMLLYHRGKGPLGGTLANFFLAFWDVMGNPMNGTEKKQEKAWKKSEKTTIEQTNKKQL